MKNYEILTAGSRDELCEQVERAMRHDMLPLGGVCIVVGDVDGRLGFAQAMGSCPSIVRIARKAAERPIKSRK